MEEYRIEWLEEFIFNGRDRVLVIRFIRPEESSTEILYLYESSGYYNIHTSLKNLIQREIERDETIDFLTIPTVDVDVVDYEMGEEEDENLIKFLIENLKEPI